MRSGVVDEFFADLRKRAFFEREMHNADEFLERMDSGFHRRLKKGVLKSHADNDVFDLAALDAFLPDS